MPVVGGVNVPDALMPRMKAPERERPGLLDILDSSAGAAYGQVRYGLPYAVQKMAGGLSAEDERFYQQGLARTSQESARGPQAASVDDMLGGNVNPLRFAVENLVASLPYMAGSVVGGLAGAAVGGPVGAGVGAVAGGTPVFAGTNTARAVEEQGGLSDASAARAVFNAPVQSGLDAAVLRFLPGAGKVIGGGAATQTGGFLSRTAKSMVKAGATEAVTEASQQVLERHAAGIPLGNADAAQEYTNAAITAFAVGGLMGSGGGFRRTPALAKPAETVEVEDMLAHIDGILDGSGRAGPPSPLQQEEQLSMDLPGGSATEVQPVLPDLAPEPSEPLPSQLPQLPLDPALSTLPVETQLELGDRYRDNVTPQDLPPETQVPQAVEDLLRQAIPTPPPTLLSSTTLNRGLQGTSVEPQLPVGLPEPRLFKDDSIGDLELALKDKTADPDLKSAAQAEIDRRAAELVGGAELSADSFQTRLDEAKRGLRGGWVQKLEANSSEELVAKVYDEIFENQNTASNVSRFAQRVGLLDENLEPTARATAIQQERVALQQAELAANEDGLLLDQIKATRSIGKSTVQAVQGLADTATSIRETQAQKARERLARGEKLTRGQVTYLAQQEAVERGESPASVKWADLKGAYDAANPAPVRAAPPAAPETFSPELEAQMATARRAAGQRKSKLADGRTVEDLKTPADVFHALATDSSQARVSPVEKMAQNLGLITNDDARDITAKGRQVYLTMPEGLEETITAAQDQGYTGAAASMFERGARSAVAGEAAPATGSFEEMAAQQAGRVWAEQFVREGDTRTAEQTAGIRNRQEKRDTAGSSRTPTRESAPSPARVQRRALNDLVSSADLSTVPDQDVIALRRMVAEGATPTEVGQAIQKLQGGGTLRMAPARPTTRPLIAEGRGQPMFKEMAQPEAAPSRSQNRAETDAAVRAYKLRDLIQFALVEGGITQAKAAKLHALLDGGKVDQVARQMRDFDPDADTSPRQRAVQERRGAPRGDDGYGWASAELEQALTGLSFAEVVEHMVNEAPSSYHRTVMRGVQGLMQKLQKAGVQFDFRIVKPGDQVPAMLESSNTRALAEMQRVPPIATVWIKSVEMGTEQSGMNYGVVSHELLHAVTQLAIAASERNAFPANSELGRAVGDLRTLADRLLEHFEQRVEAGNLNEFEQRFYNHMNNALIDADEVLSWGLTNPDMQRYLASIEYAPRESVFSKLVQLVRRILQVGEKGITVRHDSALGELLRISERIFDTSQTEITTLVMRNRYDARPMGTLSAATTDAGVSASNRTVQASVDAVKGVVALVEPVVDQINVADVAAKGRRTVLGWLSHNQIDRQFGATMPALLQHSDAHRAYQAARSRIDQMGDEAVQAYEALEKSNPKQARAVNDMMADTTTFQLDPEKDFEAHDHLGIFVKGADGAVAVDPAQRPEAARLRAIYDNLVKLRNDLRRGDANGWAVYQRLKVFNEVQNYARMATDLYSHVAQDRELALGVDTMQNPMDLFLRQEGLATAEAARDWWSTQLQAQVKAATAFINEKRGSAASGTEADQLALRQHLSPVEMRIRSIYEALAGMSRAPYFHLGRFGDHFGSAVIAGKNGVADPAAVDTVARVLAEAGFDGVQVRSDNTRMRLMMRFDTVDQAQRFREVALKLRAEGYLDADEDILAGPRTQANNYGAVDGLPDYVQAYIQAIEGSAAYLPDEGMTADEAAALEQQKKKAVQLAVDTWLEQQPDTAIAKVLTKRYTVQGADKDMVRSWAHRWRVGSISLARAAAAPKFHEAFTNMRAQVTEALIAKENQQTDPQVLADLMSEMRRRDARNPLEETADGFDKVRAYAHAYFLGFSPAYGLINMTQLGVTALPELAKKHGFSKSFHAMRRSSKTAFDILRTVAATASGLGWKHAADVAITETVLQKAGLDARTREFVMHMLATGTIDIGSAARSLGQIAEDRVGSVSDITLKYASGVGMYTETFSRLTTALAAADLHGGTGADAAEYAAGVVSNSMFDYQNWNTARQLGKNGFLGRATPIVTQFMSYTVQITEKLYSEAADAIGKQRTGESAEAAAQRRKEARRFMLGHITAVTALAGTLGMPFATAFAAVIERLVDTFDDDENPYDATAAWRNFLADVFGDDVAEVIARGLPRAIGFDISKRAGEGDLFPFSQLISDRRSWRESIEGMLGRSIGAAPNMLLNIAEGGELMAQGEYLRGVKAFMPIAFKGPAETYSMTSRGYTDARGSALPMTPKASSYLWQLIGFTPSEKAEYSEARGDQMARRGVITRRAGVLRQQIIRALMAGDMDTARELIAEAQKFDQDNPTFAVIPSLGASFQRQTGNRARAAALQAPIGVSMQDIAGQQRTRYANVDYTSQ